MEEGEGAGCEEAFLMPPFGVRFSRKAWNLVVNPRLAASSSLQLLLISWAVMACFLHWKVVGQSWAPKYFPSLFPWQLWAFNGGFNMIIKRQNFNEILSVFMV